jgi:hypothetical protein
MLRAVVAWENEAQGLWTPFAKISSKSNKKRTTLRPAKAVQRVEKAKKEANSVAKPTSDPARTQEAVAVVGNAADHHDWFIDCFH